MPDSAAAPAHRRRLVLAACNLDPDLPMQRAATYSNEVWVGDELVLRINHRPARRLVREARIASRLAPAVKYPPLLDSGADAALEWTLTRRVPGEDLGRAWPRLSAAHRERAIHELAAALAALHATPCDDIPDDIRPPHTLPLDALLALIDSHRAHPAHRALLADTETFVRARWDAFDDAGRGLVHGDPHLENVLWDGEHVSALLDLEWSRPSWIHCDLEILLGVAGDPAHFAGTGRVHEVDRAHYADIPRWLRDAQPAWFAHPRLVDRLAVLRVSRILGHLEDAIDVPADTTPIWRLLREAVSSPA